MSFRYLFSLLAIGLVFGQPARGADEKQLSGTVKAISGEGRQLTLEVNGKTQEYDVSRRAVITLDGKAATLDALKIGQQVRITYNPDFEVVTRLEAVSAAAAGGPAAPSTREVVATGVGLTPEKALANAFSAAVEQAIGLLVDAQTLVANDRIIEEKVLTASNAYIESYDILKRRQADGLHHCQIKAQVKLRQLQQTMVANKITVKEIRGQDLAVEFATTQKANADSAAILSDMLHDLPNKVLTATITDKPKPLPSPRDNVVTLRIPIELTVDMTAYNSQVKELVSRLDKLAIARFPSQFKLLPQKPVTVDNPVEKSDWHDVFLSMPLQQAECSVETLIQLQPGA